MLPIPVFVLLILLMQGHHLFSKPQAHTTANLIAVKNLPNGIQVHLYEGDMFRQTADYMVVASNKQPKGSHAGGQAKAAWEALELAGDHFGLSKFHELAHQNTLLEVGYDVAVTPVGKAFYSKTGCKALLHVAGPDCRIPAEFSRRHELLQAAYYHTVLKAMQEASTWNPPPLKLQIAFPLVSIGVFTYPIEEFMEYCLNGLNQIQLDASYPIIIDLYMYKTSQKEQLAHDFNAY